MRCPAAAARPISYHSVRAATGPICFCAWRGELCKRHIYSSNRVKWALVTRRSQINRRPRRRYAPVAPPRPLELGGKVKTIDFIWWYRCFPVSKWRVRTDRHRLYSVSQKQKKTLTQSFVHVFDNYWPIVIDWLIDSIVITTTYQRPQGENKKSGKRSFMNDTVNSWI